MDKIRKIVKRVFDTIIKRPVQNYNVEERAFKAISVAKKTPAPRHLTTEEKIFKYIEEHPELKEIVTEKPKTLIEWLKKVNVISQDMPDTELIKTDKKKLPTRRPTYELPRMFGELEPKVIPEGKISLQQTTNLVLEYASTKVKPSPKEISEKYKLDEQDAANLVRHFKAYQLYRPASETGDYTGLPPWSSGALKEGGLNIFLDTDSRRPQLESEEGEKKQLEEKETPKQIESSQK